MQGGYFELPNGTFLELCGVASGGVTRTLCKQGHSLSLRKRVKHATFASGAQLQWIENPAFYITHFVRATAKLDLQQECTLRLPSAAAKLFMWCCW